MTDLVPARWAALPPLAFAAAMLAGCALQGARPVAVAEPGGPPPLAASPAGVRTVRTAARSREDETGPSVAAVPAAATPSPREIFDFHPAGAPADAWRQPFVIDTNDGPLAADVRRSAAELKTFLATSRSGTTGGTTGGATGSSTGGPTLAGKAVPRPGAARRCGETDVATARPGCPTAAPAAEKPVP